MRGKATKATSHAPEPGPSSAATAARHAPELRFGRIRALALSATAPPSLRTYALGAATPMTLLRVASEDKVAFEALRADVRVRTRFPVTQPGMFAALVRFAAAHREAFEASASFEE